MNYAEYAELAKLTMTVETSADVYLMYGLTGELGEVANILKKHIRGDQMDFAAMLTDELGDVLWYWSQICLLPNFLSSSGKAHLLNNLIPNDAVREQDQFAIRGLQDYTDAVFSSALLLAGVRDRDARKNHLLIIRQAIEGIAATAGVNLLATAERNIEKLAKRYEHGTIKGHRREEL